MEQVRDRISVLIIVLIENISIVLSDEMGLGKTLQVKRTIAMK
jgi:hypothetical protein